MMLKSDLKQANAGETSSDPSISSLPLLTQANQKVELAIHGLYISIIRYSNQHNAAYVVSWLIMTLQLIHFISNAYINYNWNSAVSTVLLNITGFVTEIPIDAYTAYSLSLVVLYTFFIFIGFTAVVSRLLRWTALLPVLATLLIWIPSVLFVFFALPLIKMAFGCVAFSPGDVITHPFYPRFTCWGADHAGHVFLSLMTLGIYMYVAINTANCHFGRAIPNNLQPGANPLDSRSSNRAEVWMLLVKTILLILFVAGPSASWRVPMGLLMFAAGTALTVHQLRTLPWWQEAAQVLAVLQPLLLAWTGAVAVAMALLDDSEGTGMLYWGCIVPLAVASVLMVRGRYRRIHELTAADLSSPHLVAGKVKCLVRRHYMRLALHEDNYIDMTDDIAARQAELAAFIAQVFELAGARFPEDAALHLFAAQYYAEVAGNRIFAFRQLQAAESRPMRQAERYHALLLRARLRVMAALSSNDEVNRYLEFKERREAALVELRGATRILVQFWTELLAPQPDIEALSRLGHSAATGLAAAQRHYERLLVLNPASVPVLREYGLVQLEVLHDTARAVELFEKADEVVATKRQMLLQCDLGGFLRRIPNAKLDIFDEDNAIISMSVAAESLGSIEAVNGSFMRCFGFHRATDLVGHSINVIIPEPIRQHHDRYLTDYLVSRRDRVVNLTRMVIALHAHGHLVPVAMHVRWSDEAMGRMLGVLQPLHSAHEVCLLLDDQDRVLHATTNLHTTLGFARRDILAARVRLEQVVPPLADEDSDVADAARAQMHSPGGLRCVSGHVITRQQLDLHAFAQRLEAHGTQYTYFRCQATYAHPADIMDVLEGAGSDLDTDREGSDGAEAGDLRAAQIFASHLEVPRSVSPRGSKMAAAPLLVEAGDSLLPASTTLGSASDSAPLPLELELAEEDAGAAAAQSAPLLHSPRASSVSSRASTRPSQGPSAADALVLNLLGPAAPSSASGAEGSPSDSVSHMSSSAALLNRAGSAHASLTDRSALEDEIPTDASSGSLQLAPAPPGHGAPGPGLPTQQSATSSPGAGTVATAARSTYSRARNNSRRLRLAIANDNASTLSRLRALQVASVFMCAALVALSVAMYLVTNAYISSSDVLIANTTNSAQRSSYLADIIVHLRFATMFMRNSNSKPAIVSQIFYKPRRHDSLDFDYLMSDYSASCSFSNDKYRALSYEVDNAPTTSSALDALRNTDSVFIEQLDGDGAGVYGSYQPMKNAAVLFSACVSASLAGMYTLDTEDGFFFMALSSGVKTLLDAFTLNTTLLRDELRANHDSLESTIIVFFACTLAMMLLVCWLGVRPVILRVEASKSQVLLIFQAIPYPLRRALRRKTLGVFEMTRRGGDTDATGVVADGKSLVSQRSSSRAGGSEMTFQSQGTSSTVSSQAQAQSQAYAAVFKRYQQLRGDKATKAASDAGSVPGVAVGPQESARRGNLGQDRPAGESAPPSAHSPADALPATELDDEDLAVEQQQRTGRSVYVRRAFLAVAAKFFIFILIVSAYFVFQFINTQSTSALTEERTLVASYAMDRSVRLQMALLFSFQHLFYDYDALVAQDPYNAMLRAGNFRDVGLAQLEQLSTDQRSILYGEEDLGVPRLTLDEDQNALMFSSACNIDDDAATSAFSIWPRYSYIKEQCASYEDGILTRGLATTIVAAEDDLALLYDPSHASLLIKYAFGLDTSPYSADYCAALITKFQDLNELINDYMMHLLSLSTAYYGQATVRIAQDMQTLNLSLLVALVVFVLLFYLLVLHPLSSALFTANAETKAMILLAPADLLRHVRIAQDYIQEHISND